MEERPLRARRRARWLSVGPRVPVRGAQVVLEVSGAKGTPPHTHTWDLVGSMLWTQRPMSATEDDLTPSFPSRPQLAHNERCDQVPGQQCVFKGPHGERFSFVRHTCSLATARFGYWSVRAVGDKI